SAAEHLAAIKTVDGSGSGLDADLLDSVQLVSIAPSIFDMSARVETATVAIGTGLTVHHSFTFVKPSGWTTYNILAIGNAVYANGSSGAVLTANLDIGGINSPTVVGTLGSSIQETTLVCALLIGASTDLTIKMETIRAGGTQADAKSTSYQMFIMRLT
ncbi:hypothetical protein LCGC14_2538750, partial [marine sediment metagenome]